MVDVATLLQFLFQGDFLGFFHALYVSSFLSADIFWAFIAMLFTMPLYIRTHSLLLLSILWVLVGSLIATALPLAGGVAALLMIFGIGGMLYRLYRATRG